MQRASGSGLRDDEDTTKDKDHEALEGPMTRGRLKQAQHVIETRLVICIAALMMIEGPSGER